MAMYFMGQTVENLKYMDSDVDALYQNGVCLWQYVAPEEPVQPDA